MSTIFQTLAYKDGRYRVVIDELDLVENPASQKIYGDVEVVKDAIIQSNIIANSADTVSNFNRITVVDNNLVSNLNSEMVSDMSVAPHAVTNTFDEAVVHLNAKTGIAGDVVVPAFMIKQVTDEIKVELDSTQIGAGLESDGSYLSDDNAHYISGAVSLRDADRLLDLELFNLTNIVNGIGSAFNYVGVLAPGVDEQNAFDMSSLDPDGRDTGDYYKATQDGWVRLDSNADPIFVRSGDGVVYNDDSGIDVIDNTNSEIRGLNPIVVTGSTDTGFDVSLAPTFTLQIDDLQAELDRTQLSIGVDADGNFTPIDAGTYYDASSELSLYDSLVKISDDFDSSFVSAFSDINSLQSELDLTQLGSGLGEGGGYQAKADSYFIKDATSLHEADVILDQQVGQIDQKIEEKMMEKIIALPASEQIEPGNLVSLSGSGVVGRAYLNNDVASKVIGVCANESTVYPNEMCYILIHDQLVTGISIDSASEALSYGDYVYLTTGGQVSSTVPPITGTNFIVEIGLVVDEVGPVFLFQPRRIAH